VKSWRGFKWLSLITVSVVLTLVSLLFIGNWRDLVAFPWKLNFGNLALTLVFHSMALGMTFIVWRLMVIRLSGFKDLSANFRFYYLSTLAKRVPMSIWYIGGRLVMYDQVGVSASSILNGIFLENLIIGLASIFVFLVLLPLYTDMPDSIALPAAVVGVGLTALVLIRPQIFVEITNRILRRFHKRELDKVPARKDILLWGFGYVLTILFAGASFMFATRAFADYSGPGYVDAVGIAAITTIIALLSMILPGGAGLKELTASALLSHWVSLPIAIVISIAYRLIQTGNEIVWALGASLSSSPPRIEKDRLR
jgi:hypothetical protein